MSGGVDRLADVGDRRQTPGRGLVVQHADRLDLLVRVLVQMRLDRRRVGADAPVGVDELEVLTPSFSARFFHSVANWPVSTISTRSPGQSVLTSAASQAPVPVAV